jgi:hypothetical protein
VDKFCGKKISGNEIATLFVAKRFFKTKLPQLLAGEKYSLKEITIAKENYCFGACVRDGNGILYEVRQYLMQI